MWGEPLVVRPAADRRDCGLAGRADIGLPSGVGGWCDDGAGQHVPFPPAVYLPAER